MNQKEFKALDQDFLDKLNEELKPKNATAKVIQQDPFTGEKIIGISYNDSPDFFEVYGLSNNGDVAQWSFKGHAQGGKQ